MRRTTRRDLWWPMLRHFRLPFALFVAAVTYGTVGYRVIEGWSWFDALYMTVITLTTVGFSELHPMSTAGRTFTITLVTVGVVMLFAIIGVVAQVIASGEVLKPMRRRRMRKRLDDLNDHYIVCAYGRVGRAAVTELHQQNIKVAVVESQEQLSAALQEADIPYLTADPTEESVLLAAGIERAQGLVCAVDSDAANVYITLTARSLNPKLSIVARAASPSSEDKLMRAGADRVVSPYVLGGQRMAALALQPAVVEFFNMVSVAPNLRLEEIEIAPGAPLDGTTIGEAARRFPGVQVLAIKRIGSDLQVSPDQITPLGAGDLVVVLGSTGELREMSG